MKNAKRQRKLITVLITVLISAFVLTSCGGNPSADGVITIGIISIMEHPALEDARNGFINSIEAQGFEVEFDYHNALGDVATMTTIAQRFVNNNVDLILAIGTGAAQAAAAATQDRQDIPIVGTAITDYVAAGLVESNERPGFNITGASDFKPIEAQVAMIGEFVPDIRTLGILFNSSEANSVVQAEVARQFAAELGWEYDILTVVGPGDVQQVTVTSANRVDAIYIPTDNTFATAMPVVAQVSLDTGTPVFAAEANMVLTGGVATLSFSYYDLGHESGDMAGMILRGEATPAELPIRWSTNFFYIVNGYMAEALGITVPERYVDYIQWP